MRGKYYHFEKEKLANLRLIKSDEERLKDYWNNK